jgi:hypothetical protein
MVDQTSEEYFRQQLEDATSEFQSAKKDLAAAKKRWTEAETKLINAKLQKERAEEALLEHLNTTPRYDPSLQDLEIETFREKHPELVAMAKQRDLDRDKDK